MVVITGATGFIGAYILRELVRKNYRVRAIHRSGNFPFFIEKEIVEKVEWVNGDILDVVSLESAFDGAHTVIHAAAMVSFAAKDRPQMMHVNIDGTANVVNIAIEKKVPRFVYISSVAAIGRRQDGLAVNEERKWEQNKINTWYAISKYHAEMEIWRGIGEGLNTVILNPTTVLGYGDWNQSSARIFKAVFNEMPWYTKGVNGFVDVEDVARATVRLMETDYSGERFIINGENLPFRTIFNKIAEGFNKKAPWKHAGKWMGKIAWRLAWIKSMITGESPVLTRESARVAQSKTIFDNSKVLSALPDFQFTPLTTTIETACKKYLTN